MTGLAVSLYATIQLMRHNWTSCKQDHLGYGLLPTISYVALFVVAAMFWAESELAVDVLAGALLLLLLVNVRNAWDLTLSMLRRQTRRH